MEAPNSLIAVEHIQPAASSHPVPAYEVDEGVFQSTLTGKYSSSMNILLPITSFGSSRHSNLDQGSTDLLPNPSLSSVISTGCTPASSMEAPNSLVAVEHFQPAASSHPVPAYEFGEGVFQNISAGKYACNLNNSPPVISVDSSSTVDRDNMASSSCNSNVTVYYQNVRGLRTKIAKLRLTLTSCDYDVLVFTETWLREDIVNNEITSEYTLFRCDRSSLTSQKLDGGGVLIAVKNNLRCEKITLTDSGHLEQVAVRIQLQYFAFYVIAIYIPPAMPSEHYLNHAQAANYILNCASESDIVLSLGDFNLPNLQWQFNEEVNGHIPSNVATEQEKYLIDTLFANGFRQVNSLPNINGVLLDLAFTNLPEQLDLIEPPTPLSRLDSLHTPFVLLFDVSPSNCIMLENRSDNFSFDYNACDYNQVKLAFADIDWNSVLETDSIDNAISAFYEKLYEVRNVFVPRKRPFLNSTFNQHWWTPELRNLRNKLRKARQRFFLTKSEIDKQTLHDAEYLYKLVLQTTHEEYISRIQTRVKQDPTRFWEFVKQRKSSSRIPSNVSFNDVQSSTNSEAANLFALFFENVFSSASPVPRQNCFAHIQSQDINLPLFQFTLNEVKIAIDDLDLKKGPGSDGIPPLFLKNCSAELCAPIASLFNHSLRVKTFPTIWKTASVVPIHKSGNVNRVSNYRGVSILCCLSKIFEKLMHSVLYTVASPLISDSQHGFMKHRSTTTNLMCYVNAVSQEIEKRRQVDAVYVDFAKAFDTIPHNLIINKMKHIGFPNWILDWILSYLSDRTSYVVVNSERSRSFNITSGVPQGSVLGPLFFNIYVNDLCLLLSSFKLSFADDLKLFRVILSPNDCIVLQEDINLLLIWCGDNGMRVNSAKCKIISFTRSNTPVHHQYRMETEMLQRVMSICDLGVTIDVKLNFYDHVGTMTAKAFSVLGFIRRHASEFTDIYALKVLYCTLVRSILEYASPVWSPYCLGQNFAIERVQKKFVRFALRSLPWNDPTELPSYYDRCQLIRLESLSARREKAQRLFIFDVIKGIIDCPMLLEQIPINIPSRHFRNYSLLAIRYHRTNYGYNNPLETCIRLFNDVYEKFDFNMTRNIFKNRIS